MPGRVKQVEPLYLFERSPCLPTLPIVEIMAALLKRPLAASSTPVRLPLMLPSHTATMLPTLRTARATSSAGVGTFCSITAASAATATGMADLQRPQKGGLQASLQLQALSLWLRLRITAADAVAATGMANLPQIQAATRNKSKRWQP